MKCLTPQRKIYNKGIRYDIYIENIITCLTTLRFPNIDIFKLNEWQHSVSKWTRTVTFIPTTVIIYNDSMYSFNCNSHQYVAILTITTNMYIPLVISCTFHHFQADHITNTYIYLPPSLSCMYGTDRY